MAGVSDGNSILFIVR